jgi:hypothetical protein
MKSLIDKDMIEQWRVRAELPGTSNAATYAIALAIVELTREAKRIADNLDGIAREIESVEISLSEKP